MQNKVLRELPLSNNWIADAGAKAFAKVIENGTALQNIDLKSNMIRFEGAKALRSAWDKTTGPFLVLINDNLLNDAQKDELFGYGGDRQFVC